MKKLLSILLGILLIISAFSGISLSAETTTYAIGDRPYAKEGFTNEPVVTTKDGVRFYDDFIIGKSEVNSVAYDMESFSAADSETQNQNIWYHVRPGATAKATYRPDGTTLIASSEVETNSENAYGGTGQSCKIAYNAWPDGTITPQGGSAQYFFTVSTLATFRIPVADAANAAIAFWVKTEYPIEVALRCMDGTNGDANQRLISKKIQIPAGESIVEFPLSHLSVERDGYVKGYGRADADTYYRLYYPQILIRRTVEYTGEPKSLYIDNLGYYPIASNGSAKALHSSKSVSKINVEGFDETLTDRIKDSNGNIFRQNTTLHTVSACGTTGVANDNAYNGVGQSVLYQTSMIKALANYRNDRINQSYAISNNMTFYTSDLNQTFWGNKSTIAIWIKASRPLILHARAFSADQNMNFRTTKDYIVPAGESILRIPVSDFDIPGSTSYTADSYNWRGINSLNLFYAAATTATDGNRNASIYIDEIRVECPVIGDNNDNGVIDVIDLVRLKKFIAAADEAADITLYDVGGSEIVDNRPVADGGVDGLDLSVFRKYLLGTGELAIDFYQGGDALVASTLSSWGTDS